MRKRKKGRAQTCQIFLMVCVRYGHLQVSNGARATETAVIKRDIFVTAAAGFFGHKQLRYVRWPRCYVGLHKIFWQGLVGDHAKNLKRNAQGCLEDFPTDFTWISAKFSYQDLDQIFLQGFL